MDTLSSVRKAVAPFVGDNGACAEDVEVLERINDARRILYPLGFWKDTVEPVCVNSCGGSFTLPPTYEYAVTAHGCLGSLMIQNDWFSVVDVTFCGPELSVPVKCPGQYVTHEEWPRIKPKPCCPVNGFSVKLVFEDAQDNGVEIVFEGVGVNGEKVSLTRTGGEQPFTPILTNPGDRNLIRLTRCIKPVTHGRVRVYGYDGVNERLLAVYNPEWVNPSFVRYGTGYTGSRSRALVFKAKKKFIELTDDPNQFVDIHTDALIHAIQGLVFRQNKNLVGFTDSIRLSTDFLKKEIAGPESTSTYQIKMSPAYFVHGLIE